MEEDGLVTRQYEPTTVTNWTMGGGGRWVDHQLQRGEGVAVEDDRLCLCFCSIASQYQSYLYCLTDIMKQFAIRFLKKKVWIGWERQVHSYIVSERLLYSSIFALSADRLNTNSFCVTGKIGVGWASGISIVVAHFTQLLCWSHWFIAACLLSVSFFR